MNTFTLLFLLSVARTITAETSDSESDQDYSIEVTKDTKISKERIVTDIQDVINGVHIDHSYNDTSPQSAEGLPSVPGCPKNVNGRPWVYYGSVQFHRCYLAGERGPCEGGQKIFVEQANLFGYCNCDCFERQKRDQTNRYMFCSPRGNNLQMAFDQEAKRCYTLFDQGPCKVNEWLVPTHHTEKGYYAGPGSLIKCEERKCPYGELGFKKGNKVDCASPITLLAGVLVAGPNSCGSNKKYSPLLDKCTESFSFSF